jgi:hypothetical protein
VKNNDDNGSLSYSLLLKDTTLLENKNYNQLGCTTDYSHNFEGSRNELYALLSQSQN